MDCTVNVDDRLPLQPNAITVDQTGGPVEPPMNTAGSATPSAASSTAALANSGDLTGDDGDIIDAIDDDAASGPDGFPMCGSSFAMGVVAEPNRSPTPLGAGESPESSVGGADDDSFGGAHSPQPSIGGTGSLSGVGIVSSSSAPTARRSLASNVPNAPQLPPDIDVLNDEIGDMLKAAVLTTIDDLRRRKARPNLKNIGHMMLRRHGCSARQVEALLEFLVERDIVIKVDYKGQASYRNASKWKKGHILKGTIMNPAHISRLVIDVISELERRLPTQAGVHPDDIEMLVLARAAQHQVPMNKQKFLEAITREVDLGRLQKLKNGLFRVNDASHSGAASSSGSTPSAAHGANNSSGCNIISPLSIQRGPPSMVVPPSSRASLGSNSGSGPGGSGSGLTPVKHSPNSSSASAAHQFRKTSPAERQGLGVMNHRPSPPKMPYTDFAPGNEPSLKRQRMAPGVDLSSGFATSSNNNSQQPVLAHSSASPGIQKLSSTCRICSLPLSGPAASPSLRGLVMGASSIATSNQNPETNLMCATCRFSVHAACAGYSADQALRYRETGWMCPSCRTCTFCGFGPSPVAGDGMQLVVCDQCDRSYHMTCHIPQLMTMPVKGSRWLCSACDLQPLSMLANRFNRAGISAAHVQAQQQPATAASSKHRSNGSTSSGGQQSAGDVTPPPVGVNGNGASNHRSINGAASRTAVGGLPTPCGSGESTDEDISGAQFMPSGPVPPIPAGLSDRIADWSINDVATYFRSAGFSDQARLVSDQEIDGAALLLLKRDDIIHELGFKLGPALKIYQIIAALQRKTVLASTCHQPIDGADVIGSESALVG